MRYPPDLHLSTLFWVQFDKLGFKIALGGKSPPAGALRRVSSKPIPLLLPSNMQKQLVLTSHFPFPLSQAIGIPPDRCGMWGCRSLPWGAPRLVLGCAGLGVGLIPPPPPAAGGDKAPGPPLSLCPPRSDDRRVHPGGGAPGGDPQPRQGAHGEGRHGGTLECGGCHCLSPRALGGVPPATGDGSPCLSPTAWAGWGMSEPGLGYPQLSPGGPHMSQGVEVPACPQGSLGDTDQLTLKGGGCPLSPYLPRGVPTCPGD